MVSLRGVSVIGAGMSRFAKQPELSIIDLAQPPILDALEDAGVTPGQVQAAYCGSVFGGSGLGQKVLKGIGISGIPILNLENACSSGSSAFREAWLAVASGIHDVTLAFGAEKLTALGGGAYPLGEGDIEADQGILMPAVYAMRARRHMTEYGTTIEQLAKIAVKNHSNSVHNAQAQYQREYTLEEVLNSRMVADPLTLLHCCPTGDGAAAVVLAATEFADRFHGKPVKVRASVLQSGLFKNDFRDMTKSDLSYRAAAAVYEMAGLGPEDIDVAEVHDAFTIGELMYYEALGFCAPGEGGRLIDEGATEITGRIPVNPSGGLLSKGHPVGATGVAQIVEITGQLRGTCGRRQVAGARIGMTHCTGGGVAGFDHIACTIHVFEQ
ncbi:MAG: thiolase family protein [Deltaproteobacteria bacterium]|nr:thiolase family protein [Deltaproteobacteria bacterium]